MALYLFESSGPVSTRPITFHDFALNIILSCFAAGSIPLHLLYFLVTRGPLQGRLNLTKFKNSNSYPPEILKWVILFRVFDHFIKRNLNKYGVRNSSLEMYATRSEDKECEWIFPDYFYGNFMQVPKNLTSLKLVQICRRIQSTELLIYRHRYSTYKFIF